MHTKTKNFLGMFDSKVDVTEDGIGEFTYIPIEFMQTEKNISLRPGDLQTLTSAPTYRSLEHQKEKRRREVLNSI